jgi:hypothetical protein
MNRIDLPAPEATITSAKDEPLALTEEIAAGEHGGTPFRIVRELFGLDYIVRTPTHAVRIHLRPVIEAATHHALTAEET